jgi:phosphatidylserine decarboxylase
MRIDTNSYGTILGVAFTCLVLIILILRYIRQPWISIILSILLIVFAIFVTWFFRVPEREKVETAGAVTSVADGKVVIIKRVFEPEYLKRDCIQISVYMDFFDVHANFWPVTGEISYYMYHPGKYALAFLPKASDKNEHSSVGMRTPYGEIFFKQIAGTFARRIVCYAHEGTEEICGEQCGIIKFGSRIDMFLPLNADIKVKLGDQVRACESVIAELK